MGFGRFADSGRIRVPNPPAMTIGIMAAAPPNDGRRPPGRCPSTLVGPVPAVDRQLFVLLLGSKLRDVLVAAHGADRFDDPVFLPLEDVDRAFTLQADQVVGNLGPSSAASGIEDSEDTTLSYREALKGR
jgi:hypothetical protein